jgi:hypothetical protein
MKNLTNLTLRLCQITHKGIEQLIDCKKLENIELNRCYFITNYSLFYINQIPNLKSINIFHCNINDTGLKYLYSNTHTNTNTHKIIKLFLDKNFNITNNGLQYISNNIINLKELSLNHCTNINDIGIEYLSKFNNLIYLNLTNCYLISNKSLETISKHLQNLEYLLLQGCKTITNDGIKDLNKLENLKELDLTYCNISDNALLYLSNNSFITTLYLNGCKHITDNGMIYLNKFKNLLNLYISQCHISNNGMKTLSNNKTIESLDITYNSKITNEGLLYLNNIANVNKFKLDITNIDKITESILYKFNPIIKVKSHFN